MTTFPNAEPVPALGAPSPDCPLCGGLGFVRRDVPLTDPDFGMPLPCQCTVTSFHEGRAARLQRFSGLEALGHLRAAFAPHSDVGYDELFEHVRSVPLLVLDDLGVHSTTPWAQEKLFQVLNQRLLVRLPTVLVCAVPFESLEDRFRTRLTDQTLVAACVLEGGQSALPSAFGGLDLEHLRQMRFDTFDARGLGLTPEERDNLHRVVRMAKDYAERPEGWLVLRGTNGCGKTHLAVAIAHAFMARGEAAVFAFVPDLFDHLRSAFNPH